MKFLLQIDPNFQEELDAIANGLGKLGHEVYGFQQDIFRANEERGPDFFILSQAQFPTPEIQTFIRKTKAKYLVVDSQQINFSGGNYINLPSFANTIKYRPELPDKNLECDIGVCFDGHFPDLVHDIYSTNYEKYRVKITGAYINCAGFIGIATTPDVVKLAKSSKVMITTNKVITNSLLYQGIPTETINFPQGFLSASPDIVEKTVLELRKNIITETKLGEIICEKLRNIN